MNSAGIMFLSLFVFLILNVPIGISIGLSAIAAIFFSGNLSVGYVAQALVVGADSFPLLAIPLFILAGAFMGAGGISKRLLSVCNIFLGRMSGGLAIVTVVVCMFFAAISGSGPATVAAVGSMVVPAMIQQGYSLEFTLALIACAGSIGIIIPPSIPMVIFGVSTGTSVGDMFMGGFFPGILIGLSLIVFSYIIGKKNGWKNNDPEPFSWNRAGSAAWDAKWALLSPVIILGGIYGGIFTPTEAAAVSAVYSFIVGTCFYRELNKNNLFETIVDACLTTGAIMIIIGCATAFTKILTIEQVPQMVTATIYSLTDSKILVLLLINILLLIVGCFMDTTPAIMVLAPILLPIAVSFGMEPVHFGVLMIVNLAIGYVSPPLGVDLFVAARIGKAPLETVVRGIIPQIAIMLGVLLLITYIEPITMLLPRILGH